MDFTIPELGEGIYEAEFVAWLVKVGDRVKRGQALMQVMTDKATMEVPSPFAGTITALHAEPGDEVKVGQVILAYTPAEQTEAAPENVPVASAPTAQPTSGPAAAAAASRPQTRNGATGVKAAPSVRLMARKLGIDIEQIRGSGPGGRILIEDLARHVPARDQAREPTPAPPRPDYGTPGTRIKLIGLRRKIADHMVKSKYTAPHYTYVDECDVTELVRLREGIKEAAARKGIRLTYLAFFVKAVVAALKEIPIVNASLDQDKEEIVLHDRYHIGIAVAAPTGLIVPVIHDAEKRDLYGLAQEIERLSHDARTGKSKREDLLGGTFTITSIGNIGGLFATPIINHPEVGILGIGKIVKRPFFDEAGQVKPVDMVYLSFSFDHRVLDGAIGAAFGNAVIRQLQKPLEMLV